MILHIVNKSPFSHNAFNQCLNAATENDSILLIEDGVYWLSNSTQAIPPLPEGIRIFLLAEDIESRGLSPMQNTNTVDYNGFVELVTQFDKTVSWF